MRTCTPLLLTHVLIADAGAHFVPFCSAILEGLALDAFDLSPVFPQEGNKRIHRYMDDSVNSQLPAVLQSDTHWVH